MHLKKALCLACASAVVLFSACTGDDDRDDTATIVMPVTLTIPAFDSQAAGAKAATRIGDPGSDEQLRLPRYAYVYIVCKSQAGADEVVHARFNLSDEAWKKTHLANGDSVYRYTGDMRVALPIDRQARGRVYAALSTVPLEGLPTRGDGTAETAQTVENYRFRLTDEVNGELANIYSTPYNNRPDGTTYYGTIDSLDTPTPHLDIVLYHVAARLDLQWNVAEALQRTTAIRQLVVTLPDADESYIFKPLETTQTTTRQVTLTTTPGTQWYGRAYSYVVPITGSSNTFIFDATVTKTDGTTLSSTGISAGVINKNQPFTPWMRGFITVRN